MEPSPDGREEKVEGMRFVKTGGGKIKDEKRGEEMME